MVMTDTTKPERVCAELLPCPMCHSTPRRNGRLRVGGVICTGPQNDHRVQVYGKDQDAADKAWNTRPQPPAAPSTANEGKALTPSSVDDSQTIAASVNEGEAAREAINAGLRAFCAMTPDIDLSAGMRRSIYEYIIAQPGFYPPATPDAVTALREQDIEMIADRVMRVFRNVDLRRSCDWRGAVVKAVHAALTKGEEHVS